MVPRWMASQDSRLCRKLLVNRWRRASEVKGQRSTPWNVHPPKKKIVYPKVAFLLNSAQGYILTHTILLDHLIPEQGQQRNPTDAGRRRNWFVEPKHVNLRMQMTMRIRTHRRLFTFFPFLYFQELWASV